MKKILFAVALALTASSASALNITLLSKGQLADYATELRTTKDASLVIAGPVDASELSILKEMSRKITSLNMTDAVIDEIPAAMLIGSNVETFSFPTGVQKIGASAFSNSALKSVVVPITVTEIGDEAFACCSELTSVTVNNPATLGTGLFRQCPKLATISFGFVVTEVPEYTFDGCSSLVSELPSSVTRVGAYAYRGTALTSLNLLNLTEAGDFAFAQMPNLVELDLDSSGHTTLGKGVFFGDEGIADVPSLTSSLPALVMANTPGTPILNINAQVVEEGAYANNPNIKEIRLNSSLKSIKAHAFRNLHNLETVNVTSLVSTIPELDPEGFSGIENAEGRYDVTLNVAGDTQEAWKDHPVWGRFSVVKAESDVSVQEIADTKISATRHGQEVNVVSNSPIDFVGIYSASGMTLIEANPGTDRYTADSLGDYDMLVVKVISGTHTKVMKLK